MIRQIKQKINAVSTTDGGGVKLLRSLGQTQSIRLDPFLMLDEFSSTNPDDYIAGFPNHPHRGFETITYMLAGHMLHSDHLGNAGDLKSGGAQWMTAGRGIIHSEMPQQQSGKLHGFQLWINLPAKEKMKPATYQDISPEQIPVVDLAAGSQVKVIAGTAWLANHPVLGPIQGLAAKPLFLDVRLTAGAVFNHVIPDNHHAFIYNYEGQVRVVSEKSSQFLHSHTVAILSEGDEIAIEADNDGAAFLLLAAEPINEPIVQHGPFVMNTLEEIEQAIADYKNGQLIK